MFVKNFMLPRDKAVTADPDSALAPLLDQMLTTNSRSIVVMEKDGLTPVGLVTKTDIVRAYQQGLDPKVVKVNEIMGKTIEKVRDTDTKDDVAKHFEATQHLNAFVFDDEDHFVGLVHALDIALEVSQDSKAWPWNRAALMQKFKVPESPKSRKSPKSPKSPKCTIKGPLVTSPKSKKHGEARSFLDISGANTLI